MSFKKMSALLGVLLVVSMVLTACPAPQPQVVEKVVTQVVKEEVKVVETQVVETVKEVVKEVEKPVEVVKEVAAEDYTTPHPILSDLRVRQALAYCIDRDALIASVYPYVEDGSTLKMDAFVPKTHWAYKGPYTDLPQYDPEKGKALLDEAGWKLPEGEAVRVNDKSEPLVIKFTTTTAQFRQTWSAVMVQNLADCGIQILAQYVPASWWFGDTTGLARRDFELGAFAWVGEADPKGRTLYACDQIPLPSNNWEGQNYMGWCNKTASDAIVAANNSLSKDERAASYDTFNKEFAKDVVSIPVFQRAEAEAWSANLEGTKADPTEYATANLEEWKLKDGGDTIVIGMTQEPDSMWNLVSSMAAQRLVDRPAKGTIDTQWNYDYQPVLQTELATVDSGLSVINEVEVKAGDKVYSAAGEPVTLEKGVKVFDVTNTEVEFDGSTPIKMKQLVTTHKLKDYTWSDGTKGVVADMELGYKIDCDPASGSTSFEICDQIADAKFGPGLEVTFTRHPGSLYSLYFLYPFNLYPSGQVVADGRKLADVPAAEWATLPEIAETPLSFGPYYVKEWVKGQSITLEKNPHYAGEVATPNVVFVFLADTNQAVAQLINGDVDYLDDSTLGAGAEVQTVIDASKSTGKVQYIVSASPTWEHIDINLFTK